MKEGSSYSNVHWQHLHILKKRGLIIRIL